MLQNQLLILFFKQILCDRTGINFFNILIYSASVVFVLKNRKQKVFLCFFWTFCLTMFAWQVIESQSRMASILFNSDQYLYSITIVKFIAIYLYFVKYKIIQKSNKYSLQYHDMHFLCIRKDYIVIMHSHNSLKSQSNLHCILFQLRIRLFLLIWKAFYSNSHSFIGFLGFIVCFSLILRVLKNTSTDCHWFYWCYINQWKTH